MHMHMMLLKYMLKKGYILNFSAATKRSSLILFVLDKGLRLKSHNKYTLIRAQKHILRLLLLLYKLSTHRYIGLESSTNDQINLHTQRNKQTHTHSSTHTYPHIQT